MSSSGEGKSGSHDGLTMTFLACGEHFSISRLMQLA